MKLTTISISVNYLDLLDLTYHYNRNFLKDYHIVTSESDTETYNFCKNNRINCWTTNAFYINKSKFNKGAALNAIFDGFKQTGLLNSLEWILLLDSDTIVSSCMNTIYENFDNNTVQNICKNSIDSKNITNCIYGCARRIYNSPNDLLKNNFWTEQTTDLIGYFQLFHISNIVEDIQKNKLVFYENKNASLYDDHFRDRWKKSNRKILDVYCDHIGPIAKNWNGRVTEKWQKDIIHKL